MTLTLARWGSRRPCLLCSAGLFIWTSGCATAIHGTTQAVVVNSSPPGARVVVDDNLEGVTPCSFQLTRKADHTLVIDMAGYEREVYRVTRVPTGKVVNNIWVGGLIGLAVDASTGADNKLVPEQIDVTLRRQSGKENDLAWNDRHRS